MRRGLRRDRRHAARSRCSLDLVWRKEPTPFDPTLVDTVARAAAALGYAHRRITSGAGHDACNLATVVPTAMIFVPCKDGVSHNELEDATQADCAAGANVLLHTVLSLAGVAPSHSISNRIGEPVHAVFVDASDTLADLFGTACRRRTICR